VSLSHSATNVVNLREGADFAFSPPARRNSQQCTPRCESFHVIVGEFSNRRSDSAQKLLA
jgi:hypothetical protein